MSRPAPNTGAPRAAAAHRPRRARARPSRAWTARLAARLTHTLMAGLGDDATYVALQIAHGTLRDAPLSAWVRVGADNWLGLPLLPTAHPPSGVVSVRFETATSLGEAAGQIRAGMAAVRRGAPRTIAAHVLAARCARDAFYGLRALWDDCVAPRLAAAAPPATGLPAQPLALLARHDLAPPAPLQPAHDLAASVTVVAPRRTTRLRRRPPTTRCKELVALRRVDPPRFEAQLRRALVAARGNVAAAARALSVSVRQLWRWIDACPALLRSTGHRVQRSRR